jgi:hypothetical protein
MLQIVSVALCHTSIYCLLDPRYIVDILVAPLFHQLECLCILVIDDPYENKSILGEFWNRYLLNANVRKLLVCDSDTTSGCVSCKLPWGISQDDIKLRFCCQCLCTTDDQLTNAFETWYTRFPQ